MESERDLFEARVELKKFRHLHPKRVLTILQSIRNCPKINRKWIRTTRITKTLARLSQHKYAEQDDVRIMVIKLTFHLIKKFKDLFPKTHATTAQPSKPAIEKAEQPAAASKAPIPPPKSAESQPLPSYNNQRRNQGLLGFMKYFQKGLDDSQLYESHTVCVEIEKFLFTKNSRGDDLSEDGYKNDVKKLCTQFLDKNALTSKLKILEEFKIKKVGSLDVIKQLLK